MQTKKYSDIFPAIAIPLNSDYSVNEKELRDYVEWLAGFPEIRGLVVNGHTGEITSFSREERKQIIAVVYDQLKGRKLLVSGCSAEGTFEAIDHARDAKEAGADAILLMPPHIWLRFSMNPQSPIEFAKDIAAAVDIDIVMHLYPYGSKAFYPIETLLELAKIPNVKSFKIGTRHQALYEKHVRIIKEKAPHVSLITCQDEYIVDSMYVGVDGALIGFAGCIPELISDVWAAMKKNEFLKTRELQDYIFEMSDAIYGFGEPTGEAHARLKEVLKQRGIFSSALMRKPVMPLEQYEKDRISKALTFCGLLK